MSVYHVVCHDCPFEKVVYNNELALFWKETHWYAKRHNVEYKQVSNDDTTGTLDDRYLEDGTNVLPQQNS